MRRLVTSGFAVAALLSAAALKAQDIPSPPPGDDHGNVPPAAATSEQPSPGPLDSGLENRDRDQAAEANRSHELGARLTKNVQGGLRVEQVNQQGLAADLGLRAGDIITFIDGRTFTEQGELNAYLQEHRPAQVTVMRDGQEMQLTAQGTAASEARPHDEPPVPQRRLDHPAIAPQPRSTPASPRSSHPAGRPRGHQPDLESDLGAPQPMPPEYGAPQQGLGGGPGSPRQPASGVYGPHQGQPSDRAALGVTLAADQRGVKITRIRPGSPAAQSGLQAGDVIVSLNSEPMNDVNVFIDAVGGLRLNEGAEVTVLRGQQQFTTQVQPQPFGLVFGNGSLQSRTMMRPEFGNPPSAYGTGAPGEPGGPVPDGYGPLPDNSAYPGPHAAPGCCYGPPRCGCCRGDDHDHDHHDRCECDD